jgi:translation initiation factor eIF-2B subunit delta
MNTASINNSRWYLTIATISLTIIVVIATTVYFNMPSSGTATESPGIDSTSSPTPTIKKEAKENGNAQVTKPPAAAASTLAPKLSGAEIKSQKKAEKAARRQQEIQARQVGSAAPAPLPGAGGKPQSQHAQSQRGKGDSGPGQHKRTGSTTADVKNIPLKGAQPIAAHTQESKAEDKTVELFRHLYRARATTIAGAGKEVHPTVLALGLQMSSYTICGSNARLVATLQAFKRVSFWIGFRTGYMLRLEN